MTTLTRKLLVVDDAEACASLIEMAVASLPGVEMQWVTTAEAGLEAVRAGGVAAVVTDVELPGMSGLDLLAAVPNLPVIVISGSAGPEVETQALASGARAFFAKPFSPAAIRNKIQELLNTQGGS